MRKCLISVNVALPLSFSLSFSLSGYLWVCLWVFTCEPKTRGVLLICFFHVYCQLEAHVKHHKQKAAICICKHEWINWWNELSIVLLADITAGAVSLYKLLVKCKKKKRKESTSWTFLHILHQSALWPSAATLTVSNQWKHANVPQTHLMGTSVLFNSYERCWERDTSQLLWLAQPGSTWLVWLTMLIMLMSSLMMMVRDLRAAAWQACEHMCVCVRALMRGWEGGVSATWWWTSVCVLSR